MEAAKTKQNDPKLDMARQVLARAARMNQSHMIKMRRTIGLTVDKLSQDEQVIFYSLFPVDAGVPSDHYFVNCVLFGVQVLCLQDRNLSSEKYLHDLVAEAYDKSPSATGQRKIEAFMSSDGYGNMMFFKNLGHIAMPLIKKKDINVFNLTEELIKWDQYGKDRWLRAIVKIKQSHNTDKIDVADKNATDNANEND